MVKTTTKLPKKHNATDGKKAHLDNASYKIGRIRRGSWTNKILNAYDIIVYESELVHIYGEHKSELAHFGFTAFDYVKIIVDNFNEIYEGNNGAKVLVMNNNRIANKAIIELVFDKKQYKIKTACTIKTDRLLKLKLLCANARRAGY